MARRHKIKHYHRTTYGSGGGGFSFLKLLLTLAVMACLVFVGMAAFPPVYQFFSEGGFQRVPEVTLPEDDLSLPGDGEEDPEPEPEPEPDPLPLAGELRAVYLPITTAESESALDAFIASLVGTEINAVMLDLKDTTGTVLYQTQVPQALEWGARSTGAVDLEAICQKLEASGLSLVGRMSAFADPIGARGDRVTNAIHYQSSDMLWLDNTEAAGGKPWTNPYVPQVREYLVALAVEAVDLGAAMILVQDVQFPDDVSGAATYGEAAQGVSRLEALQTFTREITEAVEEQGGRLAIYLPALSLAQSQSASRYGSANPLDMGASEVVLGMLPYQFANDFSADGLELPRPADNLSATAETIVNYARGKWEAAGSDAALIPLLQGGSEEAINGAVYTAEDIQGQIQTLADAEYTEYILHSTTGTYLLDAQEDGQDSSEGSPDNTGDSGGPSPSGTDTPIASAETNPLQDGEGSTDTPPAN